MLQEEKVSVVMTDIIIENVVSTIQLTAGLDIQQLAEKIQDSKYDPGEFPGLALHFSEPKTVALLFPSGKAVCTGAKNMEDSENIMNKITSRIQDYGVSIVEEPKMKIQNIVASSNIGRELNLTSIANNILLENVEYAPDQFPGLVYKMDGLDTTLILFESGKIVCTGAKKLEDVTTSINTIKDKLSSMGVL